MTTKLPNNEFKISVIQTSKRTISNGAVLGRNYIPITFFRNNLSSYYSTYDENLTMKNNSQYSLTFSMNKYINDNINPFFYLIVEGRKLRLETSDFTIDFIITSVTPKITNKNNIINVVCQDVFSYEMSRQNISISYESDGPKTYYEHLQNLLLISKLDGCYEIDNNSQEGSVPLFLDPYSLDYIKTTSPLKTTMTIENSTPYNAFVQLANDFNALLDITYPQPIYKDEELPSGETISMYIGESKSKIGFTNNKTRKWNGYTVRPETNLSNFSITKKTDNFCSILHVTGGDTSEGQPVGLMPVMPPRIQAFFEPYITLPNDSTDTWWNSNITWNSNTLEWSKEFVNTFKNVQQEELEYWNILTTLVPSAGNFLYNFDYYLASGLISQEDYNELIKLLSIDSRNLNIKQTIFSNQYYKSLSEFSLSQTEELDYVTFLASDEQMIYNNFFMIETEDNQGFNLDTNLECNLQNYFNDILELWSKKNYRYIQNYKILNTIKQCNIGFSNTVNTGMLKGVINDSTLRTDRLLSNDESLLSFTYLGNRALEIVELYNSAYNEYEIAYNNLYNVLSPYVSNIDSLLQLEEEEIRKQLENFAGVDISSDSLYVDYSYYRKIMDSKSLMISSYKVFNGTTYYRMGVYHLYLHILAYLDRILLDDSNLMIIQSPYYKNGTYRWKFDVNLEGVTQGLVSLSTTSENSIWNLYNTSYSIKDIFDTSKIQLSNFWKNLYTIYGDYICESAFSDSDQLTSQGLYISASKQFAQYSQPTIEYSTAVINQNEILGFNSSLRLGDIIHFYNKELSSEYNGNLIIEIEPCNFIINEITLKYQDLSLDDSGNIQTDGDVFLTQNTMKTFSITRSENNNYSTKLYINIPSLEEANRLMRTSFIVKVNNIDVNIKHKFLETRAKAIELQVTGLTSKLRSGTTQITVSNNTTVNTVLSRMLRQIK